MGRGKASWRKMKQKVGIKTSRKPVENNQQGKEKSAKCRPRETIREKEFQNLLEGRYRSINKELNRP